MPAREPKTIWDDERLADPHGQPDKAARVEAMFDTIAPTYERVNRLLSAGRDAYWRSQAVTLAETRTSDRILDVACGTGDFARAFAEVRPEATIGCDFSEPMLRLAVRRTGPAVAWCRADALALPFPGDSFSLVSCAFGVRNFQNLHSGLVEMHRVLIPAGRAVILEFSVPRSRFLGGLYLLYFRRILPRLATLISRDRSGAYRYLPSSVSSFADEREMAAALRAAGFQRVQHWSLTIGAATVFVAWKRG
ncbi:MAG: bifunctional demethylmenaquinone methyltransferase/2-methoxy-6-polyprenyl-1,4-benzoquinol methylase UbiE [Planctomycetota bacterium]